MASQRLSDRHALSLAAAELMRIGLIDARWVGKVNCGQQRESLFAALPAIRGPMRADYFGDLDTRGQHGIQSNGGFLGNQRNLRSTDFLHVCLIQRLEITPAKPDGPARETCRRR